MRSLAVSLCAWVSVAVGAFSCGNTRATPASTATSPAAIPAALPQPAEVGAATPLGHAIDKYVAGFGKNWGEASAFNGYVAVARGGQLVFGRAYGKADREKGVPAGPDTLYRIASMSKPFTAIGILQLEEKGLLRIDDSIRKYLPEFPQIGDSVTIHHCLTHTSGLPAMPDDEALAAETGRPHPVASPFGSYKDKRLKFAPGERFEYSNAGFVILAAIIERVSAQSYEAYMREHVFGPAGMQRTTTVSSPMPTEMAVGYAVDERDRIAVARPIPPFVTFGCGAILSTANDLIAWDRALSETVLLSDASKRRMFTPEKDVGGIVPTPSRYALGWFVQQEAGHEVFWRGGGVPGFEASFTRVPDAKVTVVVLSNLFGDYGLVEKTAVAAQQVALTGKGPEPEEELAAGRLDGSQLAALAGDYRVDGPTLATLRAQFPPEVVTAWAGLSLTAEAGGLFMRWIGQKGPEVFRRADGTLFTKQVGLRIFPEPGVGGHSAAIVLVKKQKGGTDTRYVRLGTALDPAPPPASCPAGMVRFPGGTLDGERHATIAPFCIDLTEVTVAAYSRCVSAGACKAAPTTAFWVGITEAQRVQWSRPCNGARKDRQDHPVNCVDLKQADTYCRAQGTRLPSEEEWEWAARGGTQERTYPWGYREPDAQLCWSGIQKRDGTCPVGRFPESDGLGGIHDLAGNVWEFTSSTVGGANPIVAKGASYNEASSALVDASRRDTGEPGFRGPIMGFRCVK